MTDTIKYHTREREFQKLTEQAFNGFYLVLISFREGFSGLRLMMRILIIRKCEYNVKDSFKTSEFYVEQFQIFSVKYSPLKRYHF